MTARDDHIRALINLLPTDRELTEGELLDRLQRKTGVRFNQQEVRVMMKRADKLGRIRRDTISEGRRRIMTYRRIV